MTARSAGFLLPVAMGVASGCDCSVKQIRPAATMHAMGDGVKDIRHAIEETYGPRFPGNRTPTPAIS